MNLIVYLFVKISDLFSVISCDNIEIWNLLECQTPNLIEVVVYHPVREEGCSHSCHSRPRDMVFSSFTPLIAVSYQISVTCQNDRVENSPLSINVTDVKLCVIISPTSCRYLSSSSSSPYSQTGPCDLTVSPLTSVLQLLRPAREELQCRSAV